MNILVLAGGYGTRLQRDLINEQPNIKDKLYGIPKALVPLGDKPLLSHWISAIKESEIPLDNVYLVTNSTFYQAFKTWSEIPLSNILDNGKTSVEDRLGAIGDLHYAIKYFDLDKQSLCVIGSDTLFLKDFSLKGAKEEFERFNHQNGPCNLVLYYNCSDQECGKTGILSLTSAGRVSSFVEKPKPAETKFRNACPCFYMFHKDSLFLIDKYLEDGWDKDAAGKFIAYSYSKFPTFALRIEGRLEVGDLQSYKEANRYVSERK